jgi:hypothetical protein
VTAPAADRLRRISGGSAVVDAAVTAADLLDAIDALPDFDPFFMQPRQYARGYRDAMRQVKALLHPEAGGS